MSEKKHEDKKADGVKPESNQESVNAWFEMWRNIGQEFSGVNSASIASNYYANWSKMYGNMMQQAMSSKFPMLDPNMCEKMTGAVGLYSKLFDSWMNMASSGDKQAASDKLKDFFAIWMSSQKQMFGKFFGLPFPDLTPDMSNLDGWAKDVKDSLEDWYELYKEDYKPLIDSVNKFSGNAMEMLNPDISPAKHKEFYDSWMIGYESTIGKFIKMPTIGPSRRLLDIIAKGMDAFVRYYASTVDFDVTLYKPATQVIEDLAAKASEIFKDKVTPDKFREFYNVVIRTFELKFFDLFRSPAFGQVLRTTLDASLDFRKYQFAFMEETLKNTPIATHSQLDEAFYEIYHLKKRLKKMESKLKSKG
jgi:hypothetical protein